MRTLKSMLLLATLLTGSACATVITLESRDLTGAFDGSDLVAYWNTLHPGAVSTPTSLRSFRTGNHQINQLTIDFDIKSPSTWDLELALDGGLGAEVYINGELVDKRTDDLWWALNWANRDVISLDGLLFNRGLQQVSVLWAERCCDGRNSLRFTDRNTGVRDFVSLDSINAAVGVGEPATLALLLCGLGGMLRTRRRA